MMSGYDCFSKKRLVSEFDATVTKLTGDVHAGKQKMHAVYIEHAVCSGTSLPMQLVLRCIHLLRADSLSARASKASR